MTKKLFIPFLIFGVLFQATMIFLPSSIHRDEGVDQRNLGDRGFNLPPFFQKDIMPHKSILPGRHRYFSTYHLWPVALSYAIFKPARLIYRFFMFAYIMLFIFSFYRLVRIWFNDDLAYVAGIFALFSSAIADFVTLAHTTSIAFPYFAIYLAETKRDRHPYLCAFILALSAYAYPTAMLVIAGYVIAFCISRWDECRARGRPCFFFLALVFPLAVMAYLFPQGIPSTFVVSLRDFLEKAKMAFWYKIETGQINSALGKRVINPVLSIGTGIYLLFLCRRLSGVLRIDRKKYFGHVFLVTLLFIFLVCIYIIPYLESRLVVWVLPSFFVFTAALLYRLSLMASRSGYQIYFLLPYLFFYIATEVPPHIKKITHPKINVYYTYGADKVIPYLMRENPKKIFVDYYMSNIMRVYSDGKLNIDKLEYNQFNSSTFPWEQGMKFQDEAYFVFWKNSGRLREFSEVCAKRGTRCDLKNEFDFPQHKSGIVIYRVKRSYVARSPSQDIFYLSDTRPLYYSQDHGLPQSDMTVDRAEISLGGTTYEKGIGTHANSILKYNVSGFAGFRAVIGADDEMAQVDPNYTSVRFSVYLDDRPVFVSKTFNRDTPPQEISIALKGAQELRLKVDDAGQGAPDGSFIWGDHADWANAYLVR